MSHLVTNLSSLSFSWFGYVTHRSVLYLSFHREAEVSRHCDILQLSFSSGRCLMWNVAILDVISCVRFVCLTQFDDLELFQFRMGFVFS